MKTLRNNSYLALALFALACVTLAPQAGAVCQEGCHTGNNTVLGDNALFNITTGYWDTAVGFLALHFDTTGFANTATGPFALYSNTTGYSNTAIGFNTLVSNTTGYENTASGAGALYFNTTGTDNTATGAGALADNTTGHYNTASGTSALHGDTTGSKNTASGFIALITNTTGDSNVANGFNALSNNTTGGNNIALGQSAGANLTTGNANIDIGNVGLAAEANTIRLGTVGTQTATFIAGISGATIVNGVGVLVDADGHLGTITSSARFKSEIQPMDKASEAVLSLKPVTFRYRKELDPKGIPQFGLVAEEVEKVDPDLVARDDQGKPYTVRYEAVNAMLLNEFLKEHRKVDKEEATIAAQQKQIKDLTASLQAVNERIDALTAAQLTAHQ